MLARYKRSLRRHYDWQTEVEFRGLKQTLDRAKLCRLAWELTAESFGGRHQLYERLHSGDPATIVAAVSDQVHRQAEGKGFFHVCGMGVYFFPRLGGSLSDSSLQPL